jgi:hypothetical protein
MPVDSEAALGRSPDPSLSVPCRADPIQCAPSFTFLSANRLVRLSKYEKPVQDFSRKSIPTLFYASYMCNISPSFHHYRTSWYRVVTYHSCFVFGMSLVKISARRPCILTELYRGCHQPLQVNAGIVPILSTNHLLISPSWDAMCKSLKDSR